MNGWKSIVGLIVTSMLSGSVWAQGNTCEEQLNAAAEEFSAGRFYGIPAMLKPCIDNGFTREQRQRAFLLLTQTYLLLEDPIGADNSYLEVLRANPEFLADTARDQIEVVYLSKRFTAAPIFSIFGRVGGNVTPVRVIATINPSGGPIRNQYALKPGWQISGGVDWNVTEKIAVTGEVMYSFTSYKKNQFKFPTGEPDEEEFNDNQTWLSIPISVKYSFTRGKFRPYAFAGYAVNLLLSDKGQIQIFKRDAQLGEDSPVTLEESSPSINFKSYRNMFNTSMFFGGGVKYKWGTDFLFAEMRYSFGLTNVVAEHSTFASAGPAIEYGHADDYFRLDNFSLSVGFMRPLYKPRQVKRVRTKSILKGIKKKQK
jgi:opacity protein-like surface antigen